MAYLLNKMMLGDGEVCLRVLFHLRFALAAYRVFVSEPLTEIGSE